MRKKDKFLAWELSGWEQVEGYLITQYIGLYHRTPKIWHIIHIPTGEILLVVNGRFAMFRTILAAVDFSLKGKWDTKKGDIPPDGNYEVICRIAKKWRAIAPWEPYPNGESDPIITSNVNRI